MNISTIVKDKYGSFNEDEIYDLCDYLIQFIYPRLKAFSHYDSPVPGRFIADANVSLEEFQNNSAVRHKLENDWHEVVKKMLWSFEQYVKGDVDDPFNKNGDFTSYERKEYLKRKEEGFKLFGQYIDCLWL